jgi:hypothetical protein
VCMMAEGAGFEVMDIGVDVHDGRRRGFRSHGHRSRPKPRKISRRRRSV